jgi:hypothetical protein
MDDLDREFKKHLVYVFNQVLQNIRREGMTQKALEKVGKLLFRLYWVFQQYKKKKKRYTLPEWVAKVAELVGKVNAG